MKQETIKFWRIMNSPIIKDDCLTLDKIIHGLWCIELHHALKSRISIVGIEPPTLAWHYRTLLGYFIDFIPKEFTHKSSNIQYLISVIISEKILPNVKQSWTQGVPCPQSLKCVTKLKLGIGITCKSPAFIQDLTFLNFMISKWVPFKIFKHEHPKIT